MSDPELDGAVSGPAKLPSEAGRDAAPSLRRCLGAVATAPPGETSGPAKLRSEAGRDAAPSLRRCLGAVATAPRPDCALCPRLARFRVEVKAAHADYFCAPVPSFGASAPQLLVVGLAPGKHGANRTGRPFTGDYAGELLYQTLFDFGWSTAPTSQYADDGLKLCDARITNAVRCLPPENKPQPAEVRACNPFLAAELDALPKHAVVLALGTIAHGAVLRASGLKLASAPFGHGASVDLPGGRRLFASYHCSRYNTQTRRLTPEMFGAVFAQIARALHR